MSVGVAHEVGALQVHCAAFFVKQDLIGVNRHDFGKEHVVRAKRDDLSHHTLQIDGGFIDQRGFHLAAVDGRELEGQPHIM